MDTPTTKTAELKDGTKISAEIPTGATDLTVQQQGNTDLTLYDFGDDAGKGMENIDGAEFTIPFLTILQSNSPEVEERSSPLAVAGNIINRGTGNIYDTSEKPMTFIPVKRDWNFPEFTPRDAGGGFHGIKAPDDPEVLKLKAIHGDFKKLPTDRGTELVETRYLYGILIDHAGNESRVVIGFSSTQIPKYKLVINRAMEIKYPGPNNTKVNPPLWAHRWRISTQQEKNKKGSFRGWVIELDGAQPHEALIRRHDPLYVFAKNFNEQLETGKVKAAAPDAKGGAGVGEDPEEIPF